METFPARPEILRQQIKHLRELLRAVQEGNAFYKARLGPATCEISALDDFRRRLPFTWKHELSSDQRAHPPFGRNLTYPLHRFTRYHQTSGTSGAPLRWLDTNENWSALVDSWVEVFNAAGANHDDRIYFAFSFGPFIGFWLAFEAGTRLNALCIPGGGLSSSARLKAIIETEATILCCTPTYAMRLGEVAAEEKLDLAQSKVRLLMVAGEPGGSIPSVRQRLQQLWPGAEVFDHHGMTEVGPVTYQCPAQPGVLHVNELAYLAEVIHSESGELVGKGEPGELVLTTLTRVGSPLLRYRTGDLVKLPEDFDQASTELSEPCACGRHYMKLEGGILGRTDDMVVIRGVNIYPSAVDEIVRSVPGIAEHQAVVKNKGALAELEVTVEPAGGPAEAEQLKNRLERVFQDSLSLRVAVKIASPGSLPRFEMKARRWHREQ